MKKLFLSLFLLPFMFFTGCNNCNSGEHDDTKRDNTESDDTLDIGGNNPYFGKQPTDQDGTFWVADNLQLYMQVDSRLDYWNIGKLFFGEQHQEFVEIVLEFDFGTLVEVYDTSKYIFDETDGGVDTDEDEGELFYGTCTFDETQFTITVLHSDVYYVADGDVITFNRVDELPGWAIVEGYVIDDIHYTKRRIRCQDGTFWVADKLQVYIQIDASQFWGDTGWLINEQKEKLEILVDLEDDYDGTLYDISNVTERMISNFTKMFDGTTGVFKEDQFTITVTESAVDYIEIGDVITFNRVDELPEWAFATEDSKDE